MFVFSLSSLPSLLSLLLALFLLHLAACDLFLTAVVDTSVVRKLVRSYTADMQNHGADAAAAWPAPQDADEAPLPPPPPPKPLSAQHRSALFALVCSSRWFFSWQLVYRTALPVGVSFVHLCVVGLSHRFSSAHSHVMYGLDIDTLAEQRKQRHPLQQPATQLVQERKGKPTVESLD